MGTTSFPGVKSGRSVTLTPHPLLVPLVMKEYSYTSTPPMGRTACTEPQCLYNGALYLYLTVHLYLYSPYGPYGLYRASVPVQGVHFTFFFFLPIGLTHFLVNCKMSLGALVALCNTSICILLVVLFHLL